MKLIMKMDVEVELNAKSIEEVNANRKEFDEQIKPENFKSVIQELFEDELCDNGKIIIHHAEARIEE